MSKIPDNLVLVQQRIEQALKKSGRPTGATQLLAVSKTKPADDIRLAFDAGQRSFGENYLQEALDKQAELSDLDVEWHFIGPIQSNKTRQIAEHFSWVHSVDRLKVARRLSEQRPRQLPALNICLQVNLDGEETKSGVAISELPQLLSDIKELPGLCVRGLMAIPAPTDDVSKQLASFEQLREAMLTLQKSVPQLDTLSIGMSSDLEAAIAAGSTIVRIGTDIFGARNLRV